MTSAEAQRIVKALESIAESLAKLANPPRVVVDPNLQKDWKPGDIMWVKWDDKGFVD